MKKSAATIRLAALFLFLAALAWAVTFWRAQTISRSYAERSSRQLAAGVARIRTQVGRLESELDTSAARIAAGVASLILFAVR